MSAPLSNVPDEHGRFGPYGGRYVPETLMAALRQLTECYDAARHDPAFQRQVRLLPARYVGRPSPLYFAERLTREAGGARIFLKREDLNHTGAHKINNCIGQALLTRRMGKPRIIAETGAGQHGVATRHGGGPVRPGVPGLHGRGGRAPAEAQRLQDEGPGQRGRQRHQRQPHPARRHQRGHARLDGDASRHALHHRQRRRAASLSR